MSQKKVYIIANSFFLLLSAVMFCQVFMDDTDKSGEGSLHLVGVVLLTAAVVHGLKAFRLYVALYGKGVSTLGNSIENKQERVDFQK